MGRRAPPVRRRSGLHGVLAPNQAAFRDRSILGRQAGNIPMPGLPGAPINATDTSDDPGDVLQPGRVRCAHAASTPDHASRRSSVRAVRPTSYPGDPLTARKAEW